MPLIALLLATIAGTSAGLPQSVGATMPDARFSGSPHGAQFYVSADESLSMRVTYDMPNRKVRLSSRHFYDLPSRRAHVREELEPTKFWPTCTMPISNGQFCVAGRETVTGNTVIELWTCSPPTLTPKGESTFLPGKVTDKVDLYDALEPGRDVVMRMHPMLSRAEVPAHLLVQFLDSHDLYRLDLATRSIALVASARPHLSCIVAPLLSRELMSQARDHRTEGFLYIFSERDVPDTQESILILRDTNRDSVIDGSSSMSLEAYRAAGYNTPEAWVD